jgi:hypothetical protein
MNGGVRPSIGLRRPSSIRNEPEALQALVVERGDNPGHEGEPWREIMRLHLAITGAPIWAAAEIVTKERDDNGNRSIGAQTPPPPGTRELSISLDEIARCAQFAAQ